jgi:5-methylcytosine-specific restriction protein A
MTRRKACTHPGCPAIHTNRGSLCDKHAKPTNRPDIASRHERGYTNEWARASKRYLRDHPWCMCKDCQESGKPLPANCVDHIKAHKGDMKLFWDKRNWQAMNQGCNARKGIREEGGFGREPI